MRLVRFQKILRVDIASGSNLPFVKQRTESLDDVICDASEYLCQHPHKAQLMAFSPALQHCCSSSTGPSARQSFLATYYFMALSCSFAFHFKTLAF